MGAQQTDICIARGFGTLPALTYPQGSGCEVDLSSKGATVHTRQTKHQTNKQAKAQTNKQTNRQTDARTFPPGAK